MFKTEICDGSKGLLKFISIAHADPNGKMIASLEPHLCPTATTFSRSHKKQFISWTCSQVCTHLKRKNPIISIIFVALFFLFLLLRSVTSHRLFIFPMEQKVK